MAYSRQRRRVKIDKCPTCFSVDVLVVVELGSFILKTRLLSITVYARPLEIVSILTTDRLTDLSYRKFQMAISPQRVVRSTSCFAVKFTPFMLFSLV